MKSPPPATPVLVREYAHQVRSGRRPNDRVDFTETLYWHAGLRTNPRDGTAEIVFGLSDSVTSFRVRADAFGNNGALGDASLLFSSLEPFHVESKLPSSVVAGDRLDVPVILVNATAQALERPTLTVDGGGLAVTLPDMPERLAPDSRDRVILRVDAASVGEHSLILNAAAVGHVDRVTRPLVVLPLGFPVLAAASGLVGPEKPFEKTFAIADDVVSGSMRATVKVYPSPLANMEEALNSLLRHPHGCFEQTSSTSYPLVMAQQYFMTHDGVAPEKISRAGTLLQESYRKLVGFECPENGYEWFGGDPGHEALTAYGLMQFTEMATVMPVDGGMMARTRKWLLSRRDGEGGFQRNDRALDSFGAAPEPVTNMYILWTLLESGEEPDSLAMEIERARKLTAETGDSYLLALGANILHLAGERAAARTAALALQNAQDKDGVVAGAETTITRSGGESLRIETTSLAVIAWLRAGDEFSGTVEKAMSWLFESCKAGRFGSTQSTILALKAINAYDAARAVPKAPGQVQLLVDGRPFGHPARFDEHSRGAIELPDFSAAMTPGEHVVGLVMTGGGDMPFAVEMDYHTPRPANGAACPLSLSTSLSESRIAEGEPVDLSVRVTAGKDDVVMPLTVIGLPAGLEPRHERLKEMTAAGMIASYEMFDRELVLYWRALKAGEVRDVLIPLVAHMPGRFTAPASRVYAYYLDEEKYWTPGETVEITAR